MIIDDSQEKNNYNEYRVDKYENPSNRGCRIYWIKLM